MAESAQSRALITIHERRTTETDPAQRGREYGSAWSEQVRSAVEEYAVLFRQMGIEDDDVRRVCAESLQVTEQYTPEIAAELLGIAEGAGLQPWQVMTINARTEVLALAPPEQECSAAVYLPADGSAPRTVQTWDWRPAVAEEALVSTIPGPDDTRVVTFAEFGQAAKIGVNSRGLGVHFNILAHRSDGSRPGLPVHVLTRHILDRAGSVAEAAELARSVPLAASTVLTVATSGPEPEAACLELTPVGVAVLPGRRGELLSHTNHFLDPELGGGERPKEPTTSYARLDYLREHADLVADPDPIRRVQSLAAGDPVPICVRPQPGVAAHRNVETKATFTLDLEGASLGFHAGGPRDVRPQSWRTVVA